MLTREEFVQNALTMSEEEVKAFMESMNPEEKKLYQSYMSDITSEHESLKIFFGLGVVAGLVLGLTIGILLF